ncbi:MAG: primosomal protein N' [Bacteroidetes bacterium HGW-Bacteroidetes-21]|jgi:primosomal protein N' (replication factor Y)|nr:MAG: primosomal protein N' [Bacteroidetes bacterium HGW-Bacteroidetes-21]
MDFAEVIIPLSLPKTLTYHIPDIYSKSLCPGMRVLIQVGKRKIYTGVVSELHNHTPEFETKDLVSVIDDHPVVTEKQLELWKWIAEYYMCNIGDVMKAALPSGLKIESESVVLPLAIESSEIELSEKEQLLYQLVNENPGITIEKLRSLARETQSLHVIKSLVEKKLIAIEENLSEKYSPKFEKYISLHPDIYDKDQLNLVFTRLQSAPKQSDILMVFCALARPLDPEGKKTVNRSLLLKKIPGATAALNALVEKNILEENEMEVGRLDPGSDAVKKISDLNEIQSSALETIRQLYKQKDTILLHGVTSSGKTELYIHLINEVIKSGGTVLYLLPEIALTSQIINRLRAVFGKRVGIYHSRFSDAERVETYLNVLKDTEYDVVLGVRSSVFLPFQRLKMIIVDEEHENTYKQYDPAPRYHGRDTALLLAQKHNAKVLLGTATPSIETYQNAVSGKYGLVELQSRFKDIKLPEIRIVDIKEATEKKEMNGHFSSFLLNEIKETVAAHEQVILFQNRRGFSPFIECNICNFVPHCINCDVRLTYHKGFNKLSCHYCGYEAKMPTTCPNCGSSDIQTRGFGTEKIEDDFKLLLPDVSIYRMDLDTARTRKAAEKIIQDFGEGKIDVLVGTQMLSKGLDFNNVGLVGIMNADSMLGFPDFRAFERSFQLMSQVSGRAGRHVKQGRVIIQTRQPNHYILKQVKENDYTSFFDEELANRNLFKYPPFTRIFNIDIKHVKSYITNKAADDLAILLRKSFGNRVLGPEAPVIARVQNLYIKRIILKVEKEVNQAKIRVFLNQATNAVIQRDGFKTVHIIVDADPQ